MAKLVTWLDEVVKVPQGADEWDDAALEFSAAAGLSAGQMGTLVAALELFFLASRSALCLLERNQKGCSLQCLSVTKPFFVEALHVCLPLRVLLKGVLEQGSLW